MEIKKEYIILIAITLLLVFYLVLRSQDRVHYQLPRLPEVTAKEVSRIEIKKLGTSILLDKKDTDWYIAPQGYPADHIKVKGMIDVIEKITLINLVSESKNYNLYDLNDERKLGVRVWSGDTIKQEFEVGKEATSYQHTFVKVAGNEGVYLAQGNFRDKFDQTDDLKKDNLQNPIYTLQLKSVTQEYTLSIFAKTDKDAKYYPSISSENVYPFLLSERKAEGIIKDPEDMLKGHDK